MAVSVINASGPQYGMVVNSDGSINVIASGIDITIGSLALSLENIYIQSGANLTGSMYHWEAPPTSKIYNNPKFQFIYIVSGTATGVTGSRIGSVIQFIGTGSYVNVLTYSNNRITTIGSWS